MFNKKQKEIDRLQRELINLEKRYDERTKDLADKIREIDKIRNENCVIEELQRKLNGERVCADTCYACKNSVNVKFAYNNNTDTVITKSVGCLLDVKCKDFKRV